MASTPSPPPSPPRSEKSKSSEMSEGSSESEMSLPGWVSILHSLNSREQGMEADLGKFFQEKVRKTENKKVQRDLEEVLSFSRKLSVGNKKWKADLSRALSSFGGDVSLLGALCSEELNWEGENRNKKKLEKIRKVQEELTQKIVDFKSRQRKVFTELDLKERELSKEVNSIEERFEFWVQCTGTAASKSRAQLSKNAKKEPTKHISPVDAEIEDIKKAISSLDLEMAEGGGGGKGGWGDTAHAKFLRIITRMGPRWMDFCETVIEKCSEDLIGHDEGEHEEIVEHINWYLDFSGKVERKRNLIARWKSLKTVRGAGEDDTLKEVVQHKDLKEEEEARKVKKELSEFEKQKKREQIVEWRLKKAEEAVKKEKEAQQREKLKKAQEKKEREKQLEQKLLVNQIKMEKEETEKERMQREEDEKRREKLVTMRRTKADRERVQMREAEKMQKIIETRDRKLLEEAEKEAKEALSRRLSSSKFQNIGPRVSQDTKVTIAREKANLQPQTFENPDGKRDNSHLLRGGNPIGTGNTFAHTVNPRPVRAVPSWRKGM